jgi:hypothetical protein
MEAIVGWRKTVECCLAKMGFPPHGRVKAGDLLSFEQVSGPERAVASVRAARSMSRLIPAAGLALLARRGRVVARTDRIL